MPGCPSCSCGRPGSIRRAGDPKGLRVENWCIHAACRARVKSTLNLPPSWPTSWLREWHEPDSCGKPGRASEGPTPDSRMVPPLD